MKKFFLLFISLICFGVTSLYLQTPIPDMPVLDIPDEAPALAPVSATPAFALQATAGRPVKGPQTIEFREEDIGLQGNWRKKKDWLKQAVSKNDGIQDIVATVQKSRTIFYEKFQPVDTILDDFYRQAGFGRGEVEALVKEIEKEIEANRKKTKDLFSKALSQLDQETKEEAAKIQEQYADTYSIEEEFKQYKKKLEQFKLDMKSITDLDTSIRSRLETANSKIDSIGANLDQAEQLNQKIWNIIDDKKAKQIFYELSSLYENTKALQQYITQDLVSDFDTVIATIKSQIQAANSSIEALEKQGIVVKNRANRMKEERKKQQELLEKEQERQRLRQKEDRKKRIRRSQPTWYGLIWDGITSFVSLIFSFFS